MGVAVLISGCGNGNATRSQPAAAQPQPLAYPVYVQTLPGYPAPVVQPAPAWGVPPAQQTQVQQPYPPPGQSYPQPQMQMQPQAQPQWQAAPTPGAAPIARDNPWATPVTPQHYANSWATSQPWQAGGQDGTATAGRYRPLERETPAAATVPVPAPYDLDYGSSRRPVPAVPYGYGAYSGPYQGSHPGAYPGGYAATYPGAYPGGYPGTYPGGVWPGAAPGYGAYPYGAWPVLR
ncbi:MAG TPA: hypothetical protein VIR60_02810 [Gammaproteobacteria bacterium]